MSKTKSSVTGKYVTAKAAKAKPKETYVSDDYPARQLRKLIRMLEGNTAVVSPKDFFGLIANIKRRTGWK